ncbi:MFS transporter [Streptomyces sp. NPDC002144]
MTAERVLTPTPTAYRRRWPALTALLLGEAMNLLHATIVQVAAPKIHADLGGSVSDIQWFTTAYTLPFAVLLITGGRLGDIAGRKRLFVIGVTGFTVASAAGAEAPTVGLLIAFRVVQGAAAAVIIPQAIGLIKTTFSGPEMSKALGSSGPVMGLAAVCGPVLGGVLTHADLCGSSWRAAFLVSGGVERRAVARGQDIYAVTAPLAVEAVDRILTGRNRTVGVASAGEMFDARDFLDALSAHISLEVRP